MNSILVNQLATDFCCTAEDVSSKENVFTVYTPRPGRRIFKEGECFLKIAAVNGKLLFSGKEGIIAAVKGRYEKESDAWFMEYKKLKELEEMLLPFGCRLSQAHPFYIAEEKKPVETGNCEIRVYRGDELEQFRGDGRFDEAFLFEELPKDEIGIAAWKDGQLLGMAGATGDSPEMWQIGINVMPEAEGKGIGSMLVALLKNEILDLGKLPFYGTSMSHIASQNVAVKAGFRPAWAELNFEKA